MFDFINDNEPEFKIDNVKAQPIMTHTLGTTKTGKTRNLLTVLDVAGMLWKEKKDLIYESLIHSYSDIPKGVSLIKRKTKPTELNPDGLRIFVHCEWIKRNRFYDDNGKFNLGTLFKAINKQIENETNPDILL